MTNIFKSASKVVFLLIALTVCIGFIIGKLPVEHFIGLVSGVFAFYFSNKGSSNEQYLGK